MRLFIFALILFTLTACSSEIGRNAKEAKKIEKSAEKTGNIEDQYNTGLTYCCERESVADAKKSLIWLCKAAKDYFLPAQVKLGDLYRSDKPQYVKAKFPTDDLVAYAWYSIAAAQRKDRNSVDAAYEVASRLSFDELRKAKSYVANFPLLPCELKE